jgi:DNA repair protein RadC
MGEAMNQPIKNPHVGHRSRLKQRYLDEGLDSFSEHQILELLLFYGIPQKDTNKIAHRLLEKFGSFAAVLDAKYEDLLHIGGLNPHAAFLLSSLPDVWRRYQLAQQAPRIYFGDRKDVANYVVNLFIGSTYETFYLICLNQRNCVTKAIKVNEGTLDGVGIEPRLIAEAALRQQAKSVILAHNHPGGSLKPTQTDIYLTNHLAQVLLGLGIEVIDHFIVAGGQYLSFYEKGLLVSD